MGEVYRARDNRRGRDVAIKVLPDAFTNDGDRLTRFERDPHTALLSSLLRRFGSLRVPELHPDRAGPCHRDAASNMSTLP